MSLSLFIFLFGLSSLEALVNRDIAKVSKKALPIIEELETKGLLENPPIETPEWIRNETVCNKNSKGTKDNIIATELVTDISEILSLVFFTLFFTGLMVRIYVRRWRLRLCKKL